MYRLTIFCLIDAILFISCVASDSPDSDAQPVVGDCVVRCEPEYPLPSGNSGAVAGKRFWGAMPPISLTEWGKSGKRDCSVVDGECEIIPSLTCSECREVGLNSQCPRIDDTGDFAIHNIVQLVPLCEGICENAETDGSSWPSGRAIPYCLEDVSTPPGTPWGRCIDGTTCLPTEQGESPLTCRAPEYPLCFPPGD